MSHALHRRVPARRQRGVLLLSFVLVLLTASSYIFLSKLNAARGASGYNVGETRSALGEAKAALIGYAVSYPDRVNFLLNALTLFFGLIPSSDFYF